MRNWRDLAALLPSLFGLLVVLLPHLLVYPAPGVVVGRLAMQLVVLPDPHPLVPVCEVENAVTILSVVLKVAQISERPIRINLNRLLKTIIQTCLHLAKCTRPSPPGPRPRRSPPCISRPRQLPWSSSGPRPCSPPFPRSW